MLRDFVIAQILRACHSFFGSFSSLTSLCMWNSWEDVITVPAVLSEGFVISGLVLISALSAVNRPSLLCEWMWITGFYRIRCSSNSMYCDAVSLLFAQCLYWVGEELCKVCRCLNFLLWRTSFSFERVSLTSFCALRTCLLISYSRAYCMYTYLRVFTFSRNETEWVCLCIDSHNRVCK